MHGAGRSKERKSSESQQEEEEKKGNNVSEERWYVPWRWCKLMFEREEREWALLLLLLSAMDILSSPGLLALQKNKILKLNVA